MLSVCMVGRGDGRSATRNHCHWQFRVRCKGSGVWCEIGAWSVENEVTFAALKRALFFKTARSVHLCLQLLLHLQLSLHLQISLQLRVHFGRFMSV